MDECKKSCYIYWRYMYEQCRLHCNWAHYRADIRSILAASRLHYITYTMWATSRQYYKTLHWRWQLLPHHTIMLFPFKLAMWNVHDPCIITYAPDARLEWTQYVSCADGARRFGMTQCRKACILSVQAVFGTESISSCLFSTCRHIACVNTESWYLLENKLRGCKTQNACPQLCMLKWPSGIVSCDRLLLPGQPVVYP